MDTARERAGVDPWRDEYGWQETYRWQEMDGWQDADPWQESLERSLARRGKSAPSSTGDDRNRPSPDDRNRPRPDNRNRPRRGDRNRHRPDDRDRKRPRRSTGKRLRTRILSAKTIVAAAVLAAIVASVLANNGPDSAPTLARADAQRAATAAPSAKARARHAALAAWRRCPLAIAPAGYVNPLAQAIVNPERVDQGVDYAGVGKLVAIGAARITRLTMEGSGWPGTFIQYRLLDGADAGCYVYYAEGIVPADGLRVGDTVSAGEPIATIIPAYSTGIELGWGAGVGTKAYAQVAKQWNPTDDEDNVASAAGKSFSALIGALGGPPGKIEG
ncbi:MAG TPA: hypothetical protein VG057_13250 [Solirubrobacteraceae bacterium]|nr:hypothetical protein [Solirubrobacteraceae bacterium]